MHNHFTNGSPSDFAHAHRSVLSALAIMLVFAVLMAPGGAHAAGFEIPFLQEFGCPIVQWMKGPLAILIFILVIIACLIMGMVMKMDWGRIISVTIVFAILTALGGILANNSYVQRAAGLSACLQ